MCIRDRRQEPLGASGNYAITYMVVMAIFVVFPYVQEWWRCYTYEKEHGKPQVNP